MLRGTIRPDRLGPERHIAQAAADAPKSSTWRERWHDVRKRYAALMLIVFGAAALLLALLLWRASQTDDRQLTAMDVEEAVAEAMASATPAPVVSAQVYQAILPSLVVVQVMGGGDGLGLGMGSGVVINSGAEVLTALHVVEGASEIQVAFADGTTTSATLVDADPESDIAVLAPAAAPNLVLPATIGNPSALRVGDEVFAVGNPLGLVGSMSAGVVSGFEREFKPTGRNRPLQGLIQFDAAVNPGNSGGPLLDRRGQVVGIVTGLINPTEDDFFIGIGFATPIDVAAVAAGGPAQ